MDMGSREIRIPLDQAVAVVQDLNEEEDLEIDALCEQGRFFGDLE
ncbi:hypothetical protein ACWGVR_01310 [Streptomyces xanthophaeus]